MIRTIKRNSLTGKWQLSPFSIRVDRDSATEMVDLGSISGRIKPKTKNWYLQLFLLGVQQRESVKRPACVADRWAGGSLTRGPTVDWAKNGTFKIFFEFCFNKLPKVANWLAINSDIIFF